jgi:hypothetical protein
MSFDRDTRSALARMITACRRRLAEDIEDQLRGNYGLHPEETVPLEKLAHLSEEQRECAEVLRELLAHFQASQPGKEQSLRRPAYERMVREISFTALNRLAALRLCEERGLVIECVRQGMASDGFRLFEQLSGGALGTRYETYRLFLELMFDELAVDLGVLFDRTAPQSAIFPGERCLEDVLTLLNDAELRGIWKEDETIGWSYQYFNPAEERKKMREASQAPRNSRELAVRNQFFTPRYVVEFLTDNTLGRTWYEMRQGQTRLKEECRYLVRRYDELFLSPMTVADKDECPEQAIPEMARLLQEGNEESFRPFERGEEERIASLAHCVAGCRCHRLDDRPPEEKLSGLKMMKLRLESEPLESFRTQELIDFLSGEVQADHRDTGSAMDLSFLAPIAEEVRQRILRSRRSDLSTEEQLRLPVIIPFRAPKDPRDLKILDPACGSGHFLLYAFDLLESIYQEHWESTDLDEHPFQPQFSETGTRLRDDFATLDDLRAAIPGLILRHNLHGIDIDPRAVQIAALALWLRAQRFYQKQGLKSAGRPPIEKTNIVCAEPMPGEREMLEEFLQAEHPAIADLVRTVWEKMELAGEAGSLLEIEQELADAIEAAQKEWLAMPDAVQLTLFEPDSGRRRQILSYREIKREEFWARAEERVLKSLREYAVQASHDCVTQRRLFRDDTEQGFAFIDVCRERFDVVLMNPPFGLPSQRSKAYILQHYPRAKNDVFATSVEVGLRRVVPRGMLGAITSRTGFFLVSFRRWREEVLLAQSELTNFADLGSGVMDGAMVEAAAYCLEKLVW